MFFKDTLYLAIKMLKLVQVSIEDFAHAMYLLRKLLIKKVILILQNF